MQLLYVAEPLAGHLAAESGPGIPSDEETAASLAAELGEIAEGQRVANLRLTSTVRLGKPAEEIVKLAADWPADLLVLSTHGRTGLRHLLLGSVAEKVLRHTTCPVLVLHKHEHDFAPAHPGHLPQPVKPVIQRILVPTDFSARSREAIRFACQFAEWFGGKITLFHTVHIPGPFGTSEFPGIDAAPIVSAANKHAHAEIHQLLEQAVPPALTDRAIVREGPPLEEIPKLVMEGKYDLIICATHSLASLRHALLGSTAEGLVRHAFCPVLVLPVGKNESLRERAATAPSATIAINAGPPTMETDKDTQQPQETKLLTNDTNGGPAYKEIEMCAYLIWEQSGRRDGHDLDDWLQAESQLKATPK